MLEWNPAKFEKSMTGTYPFTPRQVLSEDYFFKKLERAPCMMTKRQALKKIAKFKRKHANLFNRRESAEVFRFIVNVIRYFDGQPPASICRRLDELAANIDTGAQPDEAGDISPRVA